MLTILDRSRGADMRYWATTAGVPIACLLVVLVGSLVRAAHGQEQDDAEGSVATTAIELGLTPESVVVAGFELPQVTIMLERVYAAAEVREQLAQRHDVAAAAAAAVTELAGQVRAAAADGDVAAAFDEALAQFEQARGQALATQQALRDVALEGMEASLVQALATWRDGGWSRTPPAFKAEVRTGHEWRLMERALRAEQRAFRRGEALAPEFAELLTAVRTSAPVAAAQSRLDLYLDAAKGIFQTFTELQ